MGDYWISDMVNTINVNHFQFKLISEFQKTSYFKLIFVEKIFSVGLVT